MKVDFNEGGPISYWHDGIVHHDVETVSVPQPVVSNHNIQDASRSLVNSDSDLIVSRYSQTWKLMTYAPKFKLTSTSRELDEPASRIIHVRMEVDYTVLDETASYSKGFKSIAFKYSDMTDVQNINVTQSILNETENGNGSNGAVTSVVDDVPLQYALEERSNYQFISFDFHQNLTSSSPAAVVITYDIVNAIGGCVQKDGRCFEWFEALWANQWKIPVYNVTYQFEIETEGVNLTSSSLSNDISAGTNLKDDWVTYEDMGLYCGGSEEECSSTNCEVALEPTLVQISCPELDTMKNMIPERPQFIWSLKVDNTNLTDSDTLGLASRCRFVACTINYTMSFFTFFGNIFISILVLAVIIGYVSKRHRRRRQERNGGIRDLHNLHNLTYNDNAAIELAARNQERQRMKKEEEMKTLPIIAYGASDEEVKAAIRTYHDALKKGKEEDGAEVAVGVLEEEEEEGYFNHTGTQLVACASCTSCSICITNFEEGEEVLLLPQCGHIFHHACIREWLVEQDRETCPLCQREVVLR